MKAKYDKSYRMADKYWTRKKVEFGFGIQSFSNSSFGSSLGHGSSFGFANFEFGKIRFGSPGSDRGLTSSFSKIDNYRSYVGRLSNKCITATGQLSAEEVYWPNGKDRRTGCRPKATVVPGHYHTL